MTQHTSFFDYEYSVGSLVDIGKKRKSNQDEEIICPKAGFFAVSDGMGGVSNGGDTSQLIRKVMPDIMEGALGKLSTDSSPEFAGELLKKQICIISDTIFDTANRCGRNNYGATLSSVWLIGRYAIFVNIGDSRGYLLLQDEEKIRTVTVDHNVVALLVQRGEITKEEARFHPLSYKLTRFVGMVKPALPDIFIHEVRPGDNILLCSDGLHGMINDSDLPSILRSETNPTHVCQQLVEKANANGGNDNIAVVYLKIVK